MSETCLFCRIVSGQDPARIIDEDEHHLAFLTIFPNTPGCTVVIPRQHVGSYFADGPPQVLQGLVEFAASVAKLLDATFPDVGRTALVFEGYGVDHLHAKLFPMHGTPKAGEPWRAIKSDVNTWSDTYRGYVSSHDCSRCSAEELDAVHGAILASKKGR
jgi:diadenosine tetraphosphate (Ap4A) HIT family hydrolase